MKMNKERHKGIEGKARILLNMISDPLVIVDRTGLFLMANDAFGKATGLNPKELIGKPFQGLNIADAETKAVLFEKLGGILQGAPVAPYEVQFVNAAGEKRFVEVKGKRIKYAGQPADLVIFHDVTHRNEDARKLEEYAERMETLVEEKIKETKESEEKFHAISASAMDAIILMDDAAEIVYWNPAATRIFGYTEKEAIGKNLERLLFPPQQQYGLHAKVAHDFPKRALQLQWKATKFSLLRKNGTEVPIELSASTVELRNKRYLLGIIRDVSERQEKEKALRESEERFKQVAENAEEWIWEVDAQGIYTYSSPAVEKILGYKPEEIVGKKHFYDLFHPENQENITKVALKAFEQKQPLHSFINKNAHKNGEVVWLSTSGAPILDQQGKLVGYRGTDTNITEFKKAEEALRTSEEKYRELINGMNDTAWVIDFDGGFIDVNDAAVKVLGYSREELLSGGIQEIDKHLTRSEVQALISRLPTVGTQIFETAHTTKDGKDIPVEISSSLVTYQGKKAILSIARNITERKKDKEKLVKDQEELNLIINSSPIIIFYKDKEGKILRANKAFAEALQIPQEEFVGKTVFDLYSAEIAQSMTNDDSEVLKSGRPRLGIVEQYESASGLRWVQTDKIPIFDEKGVPNGLIGFALDITKQKKIEENLRASEERFRAISNSVRDAIILVNDKEIIEYWNPAAEKIFGYTRQEAVGKKVHELVVPSSMCAEGKITIESGMQQFSQTGTGKFINGNIELTARRKDGSEFPIQLSLSPMKLGNKWHAVGVAKDITEQKQKEQLSREYSEKLEKAIAARTNELQIVQASLLKLERLAAIGELAGMVGHDLRNPLTGIKNAAYFLRMKQTTDFDAISKKMLEIIDKAITHADKIIGDLQEYSREMHVELEKCSSRSLLQEALTLVRVPDRVKLVDNTLDEPLIKADKTKMIRVFINIIRNAVDAMPEGGTLHIASVQKDGNVEISFADTGIGMPEETLGKLFSPLITTKAQGMGFGLAICKRIVDAHQGRITVQSVEGKGSTFTVILPIEPKVTGEDVAWIKLSESLLSTTTKT